MSLREEQEAFTRDVVRLLTYIMANGMTVTLGEVMRTADQQKLYVQTGRSTTMNSYHLKKLAIDLNIFKNGRLLLDQGSLKHVGDFWCQQDPKNQWGGNWKSFKDLPHFERRA